MEHLTPDQLYTAVYVVIAIFGVLVSLDKGIDIIKKWRAPSADTAKKLANDKNRLDEHDAAIKRLQESSEVQCAALLALLDHQLHNGNAEQMEKAKADIVEYLRHGAYHSTT